MSSALVKQALAFVDPEEQEKNKNNKRSRKRLNPGQDKFHPYKNKNKSKQAKEKTEENLVEKNIKKLLALSAPVAKKATADKLVERAVKGKPLLEKIEKKVEEEQSILFPEETFKQFEKSHFCR